MGMQKGCRTRSHEWLQTFREAQFLGDSACDFGSGGITVQVNLIHAVPVHVGPTELSTVNGCRRPMKEK